MMDSSVRRTISILQAIVLALTVLVLSGCQDEFWDPTQIGRFRPVPAVNVILDSLGVAEEKTSEWEGSEDPKPIDTMIFETDYAFAPGDRIRVSIFELLQEGITYINDYVVTETGKVSIPEVGVIEVAGLTESQLEEEIKRILSPSILKEPSVTVISLSSERRSYSILGNGVPNAGRYSIPRYDFRLNDALAIAGVSTQFNTSYVYVTRSITQNELAYNRRGRPSSVEQSQPRPAEVPEEEMLEVIAPRAQLNRPQNNLVITSAEMVSDEELTDVAAPQGFESPDNNYDQPAKAGQRDSIASPVEPEQEGRIEWVFREGKWVPVRVGPAEPQEQPGYEYVRSEPPSEPLRQQLPARFDWEQMGVGAAQTRVIRIPSDKLAGGDPRYNIVIRPGDTIHVPLDIIGEFAIMGNVNNTGYINLTGRPMTLKMAVAAAGGLGPLAWPKRCEVTRRIGKNKEETVMVDLNKIAKGVEPDFFIKPNDLVNVGTHPTSRWRAVLSNSFRASYGFAFIYDRNFADRDFGTSRPIPSWLF